MKFNIKPEQVYIVVFCFFAIGAGCKQAGEFAFEKLESRAVSKAKVEQRRSPNSEYSHFWAQDGREGADLEKFVAPELNAVDSAEVEG